MRQRVPDVALARSLVEASIQEMKYLDTLTPTEENAATLIRGIYECFRRLGAALLVLDGFDGDDHDACINALLGLHIQKTNRSIHVLGNLRDLRHNINYRGFIPSLADAEDVVSMKKSLWKPIVDEVKKRL